MVATITSCYKEPHCIAHTCLFALHAWNKTDTHKHLSLYLSALVQFARCCLVYPNMFLLVKMFQYEKQSL